MTEIVGIHHLGLTVSDVERSARWYQDVLGFERIGQLGDASAERQKIFLRHAGLDARLGLVEHRTSSRRPFDETESGLDHLAFAVPSHEELESWARRLEELGVRFSPIAASLSIPGAAVIVFRDPDNVQLELFAGPEQSSS
ncbi:MAG: glyoxylase family protein [Actinomycetota bacterium]|nr:glyoxylase family protein [Actinomycetota bacterium]